MPLLSSRFDPSVLSPLELSLILQLLPQCGPASYWSLIEHFGDISTAFTIDPETLTSCLPESARAPLRELYVRGERSEVLTRVRAEQMMAAAAEVQILHAQMDDYPPLLREVKRAPPLLYVKGSVEALSLPQLAIVGSRSPSALGRELALDFACSLANMGLSITSGLALGIDGFAHRGALSKDPTGAGLTIAVMGCGLNRVYPLRHRGLAAEIVASGGAIVSEFPMQTPAHAHNFPQRNRIVSGLSCGTLVIEAAVRSGSLITARLAAQQGREVFAIPGSIRNPLAKGCHSLIRDGAKLVEQAEDILEELGSVIETFKTAQRIDTTKPVLSAREQIVLDAIGYEVTDTDLIAERCAMGHAELSGVLLRLEMQGLVDNVGLGYMRM